MDETSPPRPKSRFRRWALITGAGLLAVLVLAGSAGWYYRLALAERVVMAALSTMGVAPASLTVDRLTLNSASISAITLGPDQAQQIERINVTYSIDALRRGEVTGIHIQSPRFQGRLVDGRLELPGLDALFDEGPSGEATPLRIASLSPDDFRIALATPFGDVTMTGTATATTSVEGLVEIAADYAIDGVENRNKVSASGSAVATLLPTGELISRVTLDTGSVGVGEDGIEALHGEAQILGHGKDFSVDVTLNGNRIHLRGNTVESTTLTAGLTFGESGIRIDSRLDAAEGHAALAGTVLPVPDGGYAYDGTLSAALDLPNITTHLEGTLHAAAPADGEMTGRVDIANAALTLGDIGFDAAGISGTAVFTQTDTGIPDAVVAINFQRFRFSGIDSDRGVLSFEHNAGKFTAHASIFGTNGDNVGVNVSYAPDQPLSFDLDGFIAPGPILEATALGIRTAGDIYLDLSGTLADPLGPPETLAQRLSVEGYITPDLNGLLVPDLLRDGSLKGEIQVIAEPGDWVFSGPALTLSNARLAPELLQTLPAALRKHATGPVIAELRASDKPHAVLRVTPREGGYAAAFSGTAHAASPSVALTVTGQADATLPLTVAGGSGQFHFKGTHTESVGENIAPVTIRPDLNGSFILKDNVLTARTGAASQVKVDGVSVPEQFHTTAPLLMKIGPSFNIRAAFDEQPLALSYDGAVTLQNSRFTITAGQNPTDLVLSDIPVRIEGALNRLAVAIGPARAELPEHAVHAAGIDVKLAMSDIVTIDIDIGEIRQKIPAPFIIPMQMQASAVLKDSLAQFSAHLHDKSETISIRATGEHDLAQSSGSADVKSSRITFLPTVLQPVKLFPVIGKRIQDMDGYFEAKASLQWQGGEINSGAEILADITALKTEELQLENATTIITFDSLLPLSTPPGQEIFVGKLDIGIPLTAGRIEFQVNREGHITAALRELDLFDGGIETRVFTIPAELDGFTIPLEVNGVKLESLLTATRVGDLTATGILNGRIPVTFEDGRIFLRNGILESAPGGGRIQYRPEAVGPALSDANEGTALFLDIVRDFQYDSVRVTIDEQESGDIPFKFKIKGKNPTVYKGIPVELNLSMSGPLRAILQQGLKTYTLPDRLLERMEDFANQ